MRELRTCSGPQCQREVQVKTHGLCQAHYVQKYRGKELTPLRPYNSTLRDDKGQVCIECGKYKKWAGFYQRNTGTHRLQCKECFIKRQVVINRERREAA